MCIAQKAIKNRELLQKRLKCLEEFEKMLDIFNGFGNDITYKKEIEQCKKEIEDIENKYPQHLI